MLSFDNLLSTLLIAIITFLFDFFSISLTTLSFEVNPSFPSTTKTTTSASFMASSACIFISSLNETLLISIPPVSIKWNLYFP